jgi:hypothetical protein
MTSQMQETATTTPRKLITGYVRYNKDENVEDVISTLKSFNAKYSHHIGYIFFSLDQQKLSDLSTQIKFRISRFESKSEYICNDEIANIITAQRDSFLRVHYNPESKVIEFLSRTTSSVHYNLVQRLFKRSNVDFDRDSYTSFRPDRNSHNNHNSDDESHQVSSVNVSASASASAAPTVPDSSRVRGGSVRGRNNYMGKAKYSKEGRQQFKEQHETHQTTSHGVFRGRGGRGGARGGARLFRGKTDQE